MREVISKPEFKEKCAAGGYWGNIADHFPFEKIKVKVDEIVLVALAQSCSTF